MDREERSVLKDNIIRLKSIITSLKGIYKFFFYLNSF